MSDPMDYEQESTYDRRKRQMLLSDKIDTSPYFTLSRTRETENLHDLDFPQSRPRQTLLSFSDGRLTTKKQLQNPIPRSDAGRKKLARVAEETILLLPGLLATRPDVSTDSFLCQKETLDPARCPKYPRVAVRVLKSDTIDAALEAANKIKYPRSKPIAVLNMANATHAGGGWEAGATAQEEALCYRSSLSFTLHHKHYPIPDDAVLYSPTVMIIRDSMSDGNNLLDFRDPSQLSVISVISCAAVKGPDLKDDGQGKKTYQHKKQANMMREKMRITLRTAIRNKHTRLVLGALGCGAFRNPNHVVAEMWSDVLQEPEFSGGYWEDIVFAVLDGKKEKNFEIFEKHLNGLKV